MVTHCTIKSVPPSLLHGRFGVICTLTLNSLTGADLELPLRGHDFRVDARDFDACIEASLVVSFHDIAAVDLVGADTAVIRSLRSRETVLRPAIGPAVWAEEGILLLQTEPGLVLGMGIHQSSSFVAVVEFVGAAVMIPGLAHDKDVFATTKRIGKDGNGAKVDIGVVARSLATGRTIEIPLGELIGALDGFVECLRIANG